MTIGTFHGIAAGILKKYGKYVGISSDFAIFNEKKCLEIVKTGLKELNLDSRQFQPMTIQNFISRRKSRLNQTPDDNHSPTNLETILKKYDEHLKKSTPLISTI